VDSDSSPGSRGRSRRPRFRCRPTRRPAPGGGWRRLRRPPTGPNSDGRELLRAAWSVLFVLCLRGELTGSRLFCGATTLPGRFAPADPWTREWFPRRSSADGSIARRERRGILTRCADDVRWPAVRASPRGATGRGGDALRGRSAGVVECRVSRLVCAVALRPREAADRVPQCAGADRQPDLGELGGCLRSDAEDVPAGRGLLGARSRWGGRDAGGLGGLAQALRPGGRRLAS
jgi:hypothetical protein